MTEVPLTHRSAVELRSLLAARRLSARELLDAHLERIEAVNPLVNAIVTLVPDIARERAAACDEAAARGEELGVLHGLPVAHKDLAETAGIRTTMGSPIYADFVPKRDALIVERQIAAGAVTVGKTNTPEFGAGSNTFNEVFGVTSNPYDLGRTCGGSSGGAAVALAARLLPLCDGSDLGGSLRNPAAFCNIVGFRPSAGRVPSSTSMAAWSPMATEGPMARTVADIALFLQAIAGPDDRAPASNVESPEVFAGSLERDLRGVRVAWSPDLGGLPVDPAIRDALAGVPDQLADLGCEVIDAWPDLSDAREIFQVQRAWLFEMSHGPLLDRHRDQLKQTVIWNIEEGRDRGLRDHVDASRKQAALFRRVVEFMADVEFLACPVTQVAPFPHEIEYVTEICGVEMPTYIDWMRACSDITCTTLPAISVPAGFTPEGLPVGLQLVGRHRADRSVLEIAHAYEQATWVGDRLPEL
jgi:amidase